MMYYDYEHDQYVTTDQLHAEYLNLKESGDTEAATFEEYVDNCMDFNNGALEMNERTEAYGYLETEGNTITSDAGRKVERTNMCGGKYALYYHDGDFAGLTDDIDDVFEWLEV